MKNGAITSISVCICTYKRPEYLKRLLNELAKQKTNNLFEISVVVVDNDFEQTAKEIAALFQNETLLNVAYYSERTQNIALARNMAVGNAKGEFIAFIDDDEFPSENWILNLYKEIHKYKADGILGPVLPHYEQPPPIWVIKSRLFERPTHPTGYILGWQNTRTGNVLLKREVFEIGKKWFDPAFGSGGEDRDFFRRKIEEGKVFVWSNEARVFETVPPIRWKREVLTKRALLRGKMSLASKDSGITGVVKSACAVVAYTICLPLFYVAGQHLFMKYLIKDCDHLGKILAFFGIDLVKEKYLGEYLI